MIEARPLSKSATMPPTRGKIAFDAPLSRFTWFGVGGPADVLFRPADIDDLCSFLKNLNQKISVWPLGVGSNVIIRDGGIEGVVILLRGPFVKIFVENNLIIAGGGALSANVARVAADTGLTGTEFLSGVPGSVGGAVRMNAGAYGTETKDVLIWAEVVTRSGHLKRLSAEELGFSYRESILRSDDIVVRAAFKGCEDNPYDIKTRLSDLQKKRESSQPLRTRTGGSTFRNPEGMKAWELIDATGYRGYRVGTAHLSEKHCNFIIAENDANARDIEALGDFVRHQVKEKTGVDLQWEIKRIGRRTVHS